MPHPIRFALVVGSLHLFALAWNSPLAASSLALLGQTAPAGAGAAPITYTVKSGDNLSSVAQALLGDASLWGRIYQANRAVLKNPNLIRPGMTLTLPPVAAAAPEGGTTVPESTSRGSFNAGKPLARGRITSHFGMRVHPITGRRRMHNGMDLAAPRGTPILVTGGGRVVMAGWAGGYGRVVKVQHADGTLTVYAHCRTLEVARGDRVTAGQVIATVNSTGSSTGNHLHFEVHRAGRAVDPRRYFSFKGARLPA